MQASFLRAPDVEESAPIDSQPESISKFWSAAPESPRSSSTSGQLAFQWELVPGVRVTWDDASQAGRAAADPDWRRAVSALAFQAARIVVESGDELA